jgi:hypothetical protein
MKINVATNGLTLVTSFVKNYLTGAEVGHRGGLISLLYFL